MQKITPFLWFNYQAEEAVRFYISVFKNSEILDITHYGSEGPGVEGAVMTMVFQIEGQKFIALNGGPQFTFSPAISFVVNCETQAEIDYLWEKLSEGGEKIECGWLRDKYGVSWQIVPTVLGGMLQDNDPVKANSVFQAMLKMKKMDIEKLKQAYEGK